MSSLSEIYIKKETLQTLLSVLEKKTGKDAEGVKITLSLSDTTNSFGQNVSAYVAQTKEQQEEKKPKFYVGNGRTFWTKGETPIPAKKEEKKEVAPKTEGSDLPF